MRSSNVHGLYQVNQFSLFRRLQINSLSGEGKPGVNGSLPQIGYLSNDIGLWHERFCHISSRVLKYMRKHDLCYGLPTKFGLYSSKHCLTCGLGKSCCQHLGPNNHSDKVQNDLAKLKLSETRDQLYEPLEQLHLDTCEMDSPDIYGNVYFVVIVDRATGFIWTLPLANKKLLHKDFKLFLEEILLPYFSKKHSEQYKEWKCMTDSEQMGRSPIFSGLRNVRCDQGTEFCNAQFEALIKYYGGKLTPTSPYTNDGRAEAAIKKVCTLTRCCLIGSNLRKPFWGPIMDMVVHVLNRTYSPALKDIPFTKLTNLKPDVSYFRKPGSTALCHIPGVCWNTH